MSAPAGPLRHPRRVTGNGSRSTATSACRSCSRRRHRIPTRWCSVWSPVQARPRCRQPGRRTGPRDGTEQAINSFLNCCLDVSLGSGASWCVDAGLSAPDRALLRERYGFLEFVDCGPGDAPATQLAQLRAQIQGRFWLHLGQGWQFFAPENFITRLIAVLESEPQVFQVGINFADAATLTGVCAAEQDGAPHTRRRPLRPHRAGGQRPGDVRHHTPRSGRQHRGQRPRSHRRTRLAGGRCRTADRQPRRGALHRRRSSTPIAPPNRAAAGYDLAVSDPAIFHAAWPGRRNEWTSCGSPLKW